MPSSQGGEPAGYSTTDNLDENSGVIQDTSRPNTSEAVSGREPSNSRSMDRNSSSTVPLNTGTVSAVGTEHGGELVQRPFTNSQTVAQFNVKTMSINTTGKQPSSVKMVSAPLKLPPISYPSASPLPQPTPEQTRPSVNSLSDQLTAEKPSVTEPILLSPDAKRVRMSDFENNSTLGAPVKAPSKESEPPENGYIEYRRLVTQSIPSYPYLIGYRGTTILAKIPNGVLTIGREKQGKDRMPLCYAVGRPSCVSHDHLRIEYSPKLKNYVATLLSQNPVIIDGQQLHKDDTVVIKDESTIVIQRFNMTFKDPTGAKEPKKA